MLSRPVVPPEVVEFSGNSFRETRFNCFIMFFFAFADLVILGSSDPCDKQKTPLIICFLTSVVWIISDQCVSCLWKIIPMIYSVVFSATIASSSAYGVWSECPEDAPWKMLIANLMIAILLIILLVPISTDDDSRIFFTNQGVHMLVDIRRIIRNDMARRLEEQLKEQRRLDDENQRFAQAVRYQVRLQFGDGHPVVGVVPVAPPPYSETSQQSYEASAPAASESYRPSAPPPYRGPS